MKKYIIVAALLITLIVFSVLYASHNKKEMAPGVDDKPVYASV